MRDRWQPVGILAGVLFAINAVIGFVVWQVGPKSEGRQTAVGLAAYGLVGLVMVGAAWIWARKYPMSRVAPDLAVAIVVSCALTVLVGPFAKGSVPFREGAGFFFGEIWMYLAFAGGGTILGLLVLIMLGKDYRSQALKRYAETKLAKPRRVVRR
jgi:hypothetical protein